MIKRETYINPLDGRELAKLSSDQGNMLREKATGVLYSEAIIIPSIDTDAFEETEENIPEVKPDPLAQEAPK